MGAIMQKKQFKKCLLSTCLIIAIISNLVSSTQCATEKNFGSWSISEKLFNYILSILPKNSTILEFGSGWGSGQLSKHYTVYSIEHDKHWINRYNTHYIYAPIKNQWYDIEVLKKELPKSYDLILIDGPPGNIGRYPFYVNLSLFKTNVPLIVDDTNRPEEYKLITDVAKKLNRPFKIIRESKINTFGVIMP